MLKLTFLGINGSLQDKQSGNTSLLIRGRKGCMAVDLSCHLAAAVEADIDAVILTHEHIDHVYGLPSLLHQLWLNGRSKVLDIYIPVGMDQLVEGLIDLFGIREKQNMFAIRIYIKEIFQIQSMEVVMFPTNHTRMSGGIVVTDGPDKVVFTSDTRPMKVLPFMKGAKILIHEASGLSRDEEMLLKKGHSSGGDAGKMARELGVEKLYLCHLPCGENEKEMVLNEAEAVFPAAYIPAVLEEI